MPVIRMELEKHPLYNYPSNMKRYITLLSLVLCYSLPYFATAQHMVQVERCQAFPEGVAVYAVYADESNRIWIGSEAGLHSYNYYDGPQQIVEEVAATAFASDEAGRLWVGYENGDVSLKDGKVKFKISTKGDVRITSMVVRENELWIGTAGKGIYVWDIMEVSFIKNYRKEGSKLSSDQINFVHRDDAGVLWIGTEKGVCRVAGRAWKTFEKGDNITAVTSYNNDVWFLGNRKLWKVDSENRWAQIRLDSRVTNGAVKGMAFDNEGRIYLASDIFSRYDIIEDTLAVYGKEIGYVSDQSLTVTCDQQGNMWVGTKHNGLFRFRLYFVEQEAALAKFSAILFSEKELQCSGDRDGSLRIRATGGAPPYTYEWSCAGCGGESAKGLGPGVYSVTVTDQTGSKYDLNTRIVGPEPIRIKVMKNKNISRPNAKDGMLEVLAVGGTGELKYKWKNGGKDPYRPRLKEGDYSVTVTDENGCTAKRDLKVHGVKILPVLLSVNELEVGQTIPIDQLYFEADSTNFSSASVPALEEVYDFLMENPEVKVEIGGHTNSLPAEEYCDWLSSKRAETVAQYFYNKNIPEERLSFKGYGKRVPIAPNGTELGRIKNQRVELKVLNKGG